MRRILVIAALVLALLGASLTTAVVSTVATAAPAAAETVNYKWKTDFGCDVFYRHFDRHDQRAAANVIVVSNGNYCNLHAICVEYWQWGQPLKWTCNTNGDYIAGPSQSVATDSCFRLYGLYPNKLKDRWHGGNTYGTPCN